MPTLRHHQFGFLITALKTVAGDLVLVFSTACRANNLLSMGNHVTSAPLLKSKSADKPAVTFFKFQPSDDKRQWQSLSALILLLVFMLLLFLQWLTHILFPHIKLWTSYLTTSALGATVAGLVFYVAFCLHKRNWETVRKRDLQLRKLSRAVEQSPASIVITDLAGIIEYVNPKFLKVTGYLPDEIIGQSPRILKSGEIPSDNYRRLWKTITAGKEWHGEFHNRRKDGSLFWEWAVISPIFDETGAITHYLAVKEDITQRRQVKEALRKSEARYRSLFNNMLEGVAYCRMIYQDNQAADFIYLMVNPAFERITGLKQVIDRKATEIIPKLRELHPELFEIYGRVANGNGAEEFEIFFGPLQMWLEISVYSPAQDHFVAVFDDITKRRQAETALQLFRTLVDHSNDGIEVIDPVTGRFLDINETTCQRLGYSRQEMLSMSVSDVDPIAVTPDTWPGMVEQIRQSEFQVIKGVHRRKDGSTFPIEVSVRYVKGKCDYLVANVRDIAERVRAEQELHKSEEKFRQLAENINEVFWMTNASRDQVLYVSPAFEKIWGYTCETLYERPQTWLEAIHANDHDRVCKAMTEKQASGNYDEQYRIVRPDNDVRWIHDHAFPICNATGEVYRIVGTAEDITSQKRIEEQLRQSQKMEGIGQLAGGVAHDFNNMLAVIQMQSGLLKVMGKLSKEQEDIVDEIGATVQRASTLTRQLLLFSRREVFHPHDLDLNESISGTTKMLQRILGEHIQMQLKLATQPMNIHADAGMMDQVLMNLCVNARDAMPNGGQLIIETSGIEFDDSAVAQSAQIRPGSFVRLSVSDSGSGMPPEILHKIFEPFFTTKDVGKGTGLGLATVFGIIQEHQGWINVYSEVNHGTTFRIYIPRQFPVDDKQASQPTAKTMCGGDETILLVEDDPTLRDSVRKTLLQLGYQILEAPTGVKALDVWRRHQNEISLVLTDLVMPDGMTGKELALHILQDSSKAKVIYMSGYSAEVAGKNFPLNEGINFLVKPFQAHKLANIIRVNLDN